LEEAVELSPYRLRDDDSNLYAIRFFNDKNGILFQDICKAFPYSFVQTTINTGFVLKFELKDLV
jgi:hypothetical protein